MKYLPEEKLLYENKLMGLIITTHRIRGDMTGFGSTTVKSLMIDKVSAVSFRRKSQPWFLFLSIFLLLIGFLSIFDENVSIILILFGGCLLLAYFGSIRKVLEISSSGGTIQRKIDLEEARKIMEIIEDAQDARYFKSDI